MRVTKRRGVRTGLASLELVLITAVTVPLAALLFILAVKICAYVFRGSAGLITAPWL